MVYQRDGVEHRQEASVVIRSAFCVENPRLLLHSASAAFPDGLANSSGLVGRGIMAHLADAFLARFARGGGWSWITSSLWGRIVQRPSSDRTSARTTNRHSRRRAKRVCRSVDSLWTIS